MGIEDFGFNRKPEKGGEKHLKSEPFFKACENSIRVHEIAADFHPIALVRRVKPLRGFVHFYPIPKIPYQNRITDLVIINADIMGAISIVSKSKFTMKEVFL